MPMRPIRITEDVEREIMAAEDYAQIVGLERRVGWSVLTEVWELAERAAELPEMDPDWVEFSWCAVRSGVIETLNSIMARRILRAEELAI